MGVRHSVLGPLSVGMHLDASLMSVTARQCYMAMRLSIAFHRPCSLASRCVGSAAQLWGYVV